MKKTLNLLIIMAGLCFGQYNWQPLGLKGIEVTALAAGQFYGQTVLFAGTKSEGIFECGFDGSSDRMFSLRGDPKEYPGLKNVNCLYYLYREDDIGRAIFAGTDSGLYVRYLGDGAGPGWKLIELSANFRSLSIQGSGDTLFCLCGGLLLRIDEKDTWNGGGVLRSFDGGNTWTYCRIPSDAVDDRTVLDMTSMAFQEGELFIAALKDSSALTWGGILHSDDYGFSWDGYADYHTMNSLIYYRPALTDSLRLLVGTELGFTYTTNIESDNWFPLENQLEGIIPRHLYVEYDSNSDAACIFASSDSGIYVLDYLNAQQYGVEWVQTLDIPTYAVTSNRQYDPACFAATTDGVYRFGPPLNAKQISYRQNSPGYRTSQTAAHAQSIYRINGQKINSHLKARIQLPGNMNKFIIGGSGISASGIIICR
jgi:hypothetical protein